MILTIIYIVSNSSLYQIHTPHFNFYENKLYNSIPENALSPISVVNLKTDDFEINSEKTPIEINNKKNIANSELKNYNNIFHSYYSIESEYSVVDRINKNRIRSIIFIQKIIKGYLFRNSFKLFLIHNYACSVLVKLKCKIFLHDCQNDFINIIKMIFKKKVLEEELSNLLNECEGEYERETSEDRNINVNENEIVNEDLYKADYEIKSVSLSTNFFKEYRLISNDNINLITKIQATFKGYHLRHTIKKLLKKIKVVNIDISNNDNIDNDYDEENKYEVGLEDGVKVGYEKENDLETDKIEENDLEYHFKKNNIFKLSNEVIKCSGNENNQLNKEQEC